MTNNAVNWLISDNTITVNYNGQTYMLARGDAYADKLITALKTKNYEELPNLLSAASRIETFSGGTFKVVDGEILVDGKVAPGCLGQRIKQFADQGLPYEPLVKFARNLQANPSYRALNELYAFLEHNTHPITQDGNFCAYKKVRADFKDCHTGTMDNSPGKTVSIPRSQVNENSEETCSYGLHCAAYQYAKDFYGGGILLEVEVNPKDVCAIPKDYSSQKMRVSSYKVIRVIEEEIGTDVALRITNED